MNLVFTRMPGEIYSRRLRCLFSIKKKKKEKKKKKKREREKKREKKKREK